MLRITQCIQRVTFARSTCVAQQTIREEEQFGPLVVLKNHQRRFHNNFDTKEKRRRQKGKQEEPGADREWFRQHIGHQYFTCDAFGLGSAVVLGLQFGHLCNLFVQRRDIHSVSPPWTQQDQCQLLHKLQHEGLFVRRILPETSSTSTPDATKPSASGRKERCDAFEAWASEEEESLHTYIPRKRSLVDDLVLPYEQASASRLAVLDLSEDSPSSFSTSKSSTLDRFGEASTKSSTQSLATKSFPSSKPITETETSSLWTTTSSSWTSSSTRNTSDSTSTSLEGVPWTSSSPPPSPPPSTATPEADSTSTPWAPSPEVTSEWHALCRTYLGLRDTVRGAELVASGREGRTGAGLGQGSGQAVGQGLGQAVGQASGQAVGQAMGQAAGQGLGQAVGQSSGQAVGQAGTREAFRLWERAADTTGNAAARFNTALCYETGQGVERDIRKAIEYYSLAAGLKATSIETPFESPHTGAAYNLAVLYINHPELLDTQAPRSLQPRFLLERAAKSGMVEAMRGLGQTLLDDEDASIEDQQQGLQWLHKAALEHQDGESGYYLAHCYWEGMDCLPQDLEAALEYFELAQRSGVTEAEEHVVAVREQLHKQRFESLLESLQRNQAPSPQKLKGSQSVPTLSQSLKHHLLEFNLSEWDSGFSSPTENSTDLWENAIGITEISTHSEQQQPSDVKFCLGDEVKFGLDGEMVEMEENRKMTVKVDTSKKSKQPDMLSLMLGGFGNVPVKTEKQGKVAKM